MIFCDKNAVKYYCDGEQYLLIMCAEIRCLLDFLKPAGWHKFPETIIEKVKGCEHKPVFYNFRISKYTEYFDELLKCGILKLHILQALDLIYAIQQ